MEAALPLVKTDSTLDSDLPRVMFICPIGYRAGYRGHVHRRTGDPRRAPGGAPAVRVPDRPARHRGGRPGARASFGTHV